MADELPKRKLICFMQKKSAFRQYAIDIFPKKVYNMYYLIKSGRGTGPVKPQQPGCNSSKVLIPAVLSER